MIDTYLSLIKSGEGREVEFKQEWSSNDVISRVICSFANTNGGLIFFGVNDSAIIKGIPKKDLDIYQRKITECIKSVSPNPVVEVVVDKFVDKYMVIVKVKRSQDNSYCTFKGAIYIRVGSTSQRLDGQTQLDFLRHRQILSFDETIAQDAKISDIDKYKVEEYLSLRGNVDFFNSKTLEDFLINTKLAEKLNNSINIKNSAILLFGKNPKIFHPQSEIKLVHFLDIEPVDIIDYKLLQTDIVNSIEEVIKFLKYKIAKRIFIDTSAKRDEVYEYPLSVIREAVVNAITHRDYFSKDSIQISIFPNRIEITSPGSLPNELNKELFGTISVQRNPLIYRFLRDLGYVEGLGTGIPRIKNEMKKAGLPEPSFILTDQFLRIILYNKADIVKKDLKEHLNSRHLKAIEYIKENGKIKAIEFAEINNVSYATAVNEINLMIQAGLIEKVGAYRGVYYVLAKN